MISSFNPTVISDHKWITVFTSFYKYKILEVDNLIYDESNECLKS